MKIARFLLFLTAFATGSHAFAQYSVSSQYQHQANKGDFELTPQVGAGSIKYNYGSSNTELGSATNKYLNANLTGEYGISDMVSVGIAIGYQKDSYSQSAGSTGTGGSQGGDGMVDPTIFLNARADTGAGMIRYGALARFAVGHLNLGDTSLNEYSGGMTFTPYVGYEYMFGLNTVGARVTYDLVQTDRNVDTNLGQTKVKNGNELTATVFYEMNYKPVIIGIDAGVQNYQATSWDASDGNGGTVGSLGNSYTTAKVDIYAAYTMAENLTLIPQVGYGTPDSGSQVGRLLNEGTNGSDGLNGSIALRIGF